MLILVLEIVYGTLKKEDKNGQASRLANHLTFDSTPVKNLRDEIEQKSTNLRCFNLKDILEKTKQEFYETKLNSIKNLAEILEKYLSTLKQLKELDNLMRPTLSKECLDTASVEAKVIKNELKNNSLLILKLGDKSFILNFYRSIDADLYKVMDLVFD